ncbi:hypothetical protein RJI07_01760 [Mycoplasmatota bacterium WC30]
MRKSNTGFLIGILVLFFASGIMFSTDEFKWSDISPVFLFVVFFLISTRLRKKTVYTRRNQPRNNQPTNNHLINDQSLNNQKRDYKTDSTLGKFSVHCVKCNVLISSEDKHCSECGAIQKDTIKCEYCGHENPRSNALCEKCNGFL